MRSFGIRQPHVLSGQPVTIRLHQPHPLNQIKDGEVFVVEDWWENVNGQRWTVSVLGGNPAAILYAKRAVQTPDRLHGGFEPIDDVVYGKVGPFGHLLHESEMVP